MTTIAALGFSQDTNVPMSTFEQKAPLSMPQAERNHLGTVYVAMSVSDSEIPKTDEKLQPGMGLGYRAAYGHHTVDIFAEGNTKEVRNVEKEKVANYSYTLPRVSYFFYATPEAKGSFYAGAGLGFGGLKETSTIDATEAVVAEDGTVTTEAQAARNDIQEFHGIVPSASLGYEYGRQKGWRTFVQLDVSQPTIAAIKDGSLPGPRAAIRMGAGF